MNTCEVCGEEELTVKVLDIMRDTLEVEGNIITFNIALKRLAKAGNIAGCEGILIGMLNEGLEPNVVSYTTTIGACAKEGMKNPVMASTWLQRMRMRIAQPNTHTTRFHPVWIRYLQGFDIFLRETKKTLYCKCLAVRYDTVSK